MWKNTALFWQRDSPVAPTASGVHHGAPGTAPLGPPQPLRAHPHIPSESGQCPPHQASVSEGRLEMERSNGPQRLLHGLALIGHGGASFGGEEGGEEGGMQPHSKGKHLLGVAMGLMLQLPCLIMPCQAYDMLPCRPHAVQSPSEWIQLSAPSAAVRHGLG